GLGVGVATKDGLKVKKGYPAINPAPLDCMCKIAKETLKKFDSPIYIAICVENGENIAKETANQKVGVLGGISILGTTGIVKPISNEAFLDSIKTEISVIAVDSKEIILTIGNTAHKEAIEEYGEYKVVEIGNFVKDTIDAISQYQFTNITLIAGIGKMAKIGQGFKNTHNKYGDTDFNIVNGWLLELGINIDISEVKTIKGVFEKLENEVQRELFTNVLKEKAKNALLSFLPDKSSMQIYTKLSKA
ncbi:MAG: cobalt-precorrin-6A synthase, partial [Pseudomonadota bacterium]